MVEIRFRLDSYLLYLKTLYKTLVLRMYHFLRTAAASVALITLCWLPAGAQTTRTRERCGAVENMAELRRQFPEIETEAEFEQRMAVAIEQEKQRMNNAEARNFDDVMTIPVVFHVIHQGQAIGSGDNIPDAQLLSQLKVMNDDYGRKPGTRGWNNDSRGADTRIQFALIKRDPSGNASSGVDRINAVSLGITKPAAGYSQTTLQTIKSRTSWDPTRYFNVWVCDVSGLYGVAQFPINSSLPGLACTPNPSAANTDGLTISPICTGSLDDGAWANIDPGAAYGRTATHETGHWLGLRHIWGDANCGTDYCEDTPIHQAANQLTCPTHPKSNTCGTADEMFENYMDYSADNCVNIFTRDQMIRMRAVLRTCPRRKELLNSIALQPPVAVDAGLADILAPLRDYCNGTSEIKVVAKNWGNSNLTNLTLNYQIGQGSVVTQTQTLNLASNSLDTLSLGNVTLPAGENTVRVWSTLPNGQADTLNAQDTISTVVKVGSGIAIPTTENFEGVNTPPSYWSINNPNGDCKTWRMQSVPVGSSGQRSVAAYFGFFQNTAARTVRDELYTPLYDLAGDTSAYLYFHLAHARSSSTSFGRLKVEVSTDCGLTWDSVYSKNGAALTTITGSQAAEWFPTAANQWRKEAVNLHAYAGHTVRLRFVALNTGGNNLFVDNVVLARGVPQAPVITRFVPDSGGIGTRVTIYGRNLATTSSVTFKSALSFNVQALSDTMLVTTVPTGATTGKIKVITSVDSVRSANNFTIIAAPAITSFTPSSGPIGTTVVVNGTGFGRVRKAYVNGVQATNMTINSATHLTLTVPVGATTGRIALVTRTDSVYSSSDFAVGNFITMRSGGVDSTCSAIFVSPGYPGQYINNLNLTHKLYAPAGRQVILQLTSFSTEATYDFVSIYNGPSTASPALLTRKSGTFTGTLPTYTSTNGVLTIVFTSDNSGTSTGFSANVSCSAPPFPVISGMSPRQGPVGYPFAIQGTGLANVDTVWFGDIKVTNVTKTATSITGLVPAGAVDSKIRVHSPTGSDTSSQTYVVTSGMAYCQPQNAACSATSGMRRVNLVGSTLATLTPCSDASGAAFTIYPMADSTTGTLLSGGLMQLRVWSAGAGQQVGAWVDINRNGTYENTEFMPAVAQPTALTPGIIAIQLPSTMDTGMVGMRIRSGSVVAATGACSNSNNGSAAEFTMRVQACPSVAGPTSVVTDTICAGDTATLSVQGAGTPLWFSQATGLAIADTGHTVRPILNVTTTVYVAMWQNSCLSPRTPVAVEVNALPAANFQITDNLLSVATGTIAPGNTYQWYKNGSPIPGATSLDYTIDSTGNYALMVTNAKGCSQLSASQLVLYVGTAKAMSTLRLTVVPNPSTGIFFVKATQKVQRAEVLDMMGRSVWSGEISGTVRLDLSGLGKGLYMLHTPGVSALRLVVE